MGVFRDYDQAALDAQYNNRARVPGFEAFIERWTRDSEAARDRLHGRLDLAYGPGPRDRLDLFPAARAGAPVLVFIHGGYWQSLDKSAFSYLAPPFVEAGIAFAALEYPLAPEVGLDEITAHCRAGLHWLWRHAADYGLDAERLFVAGHSAGGHLTAMALTTDWSRFAGAAPDLVKGGCAISGLYDLEPIRLCYLNQVLGMDAAVANRNSPVHNLASARGALVAAVGGDESDEFHRQTADFVAAWRDRGLEAAVVEMPGRHHFDVLDQLSTPDGALHRAVMSQILG